MFYPPELKPVQYFAIDPGKNGAIVKKTDIYQTFPLKRLAEDFNNMVDWFREQAEICTNPIIIVEKITIHSQDYDIDSKHPQKRSQAIGRQIQMQKMHAHYTELISAIKLSKIPYLPVMPRVMQKYLNLQIRNEEYNIRKKRFKDIAQMHAPGHRITYANSDCILYLEFLSRKLMYEKEWVLRELKKTQHQKTNIF